MWSQTEKINHYRQSSLSSPPAYFRHPGLLYYTNHAKTFWTAERLPFGKAPLKAQKAANKTDLIRDEHSIKLMETSPPEHHANGVLSNGVDAGSGAPRKLADL